MNITSAVFVRSSPNTSLIPEHQLPEYAFIGRSNVGKSSLINMLAGHKNLAHTSAKPGKTQMINHFIINGAWYIVDLPGYGYAKTSKSQRSVLSKIIGDYIKNSRQMTQLFVLIDVRLEPQPIDLTFLEQLGSWGVPFAIIFTKADKLSKTALQHNVEQYAKRLLEQWEELPPYFVTSAEQATGKQNLLDYIETVNAGLKL